MGRAKLLTNKQVREQERQTVTQDYSIKEIREWLGMTQAELARKSGISRAAIANVESDRYVMSARDGIEVYLALRSSIPPELPREREKMRRAVVRLFAFQRNLDRKKLIDIGYQIERLEREREALKASAAELDSKEALLTSE